MTDRRSATVDLPAPGEHNVLNALAALAACEVTGCRLEQAAAALASFRPAGPAFRAARRGARRAGVRRLRPPRDGGGGDAAGGPRRWRRGGWSPSSSPTSTHARCTPTASWAARWRSRTWSWCSTSTRPGSCPRASSPGVSGKLVADAAADSAHGRQVWWLPTLPEAERVAGGPGRERGPRPDAGRGGRQRPRRRPPGAAPRAGMTSGAELPSGPRARLSARPPHHDPHRWASGLVRPPAERLRARGPAAVGGRVADRRRSSGLGIEPPRS